MNEEALKKQSSHIITQQRGKYNSGGTETSMPCIGLDRLLYRDRVSLSQIISDPSLEEDKAAYFTFKGCITSINPNQRMWYQACKTCNKAVTPEADSSTYFCTTCRMNHSEWRLRYIMVVRVSDRTGEAWLTSFGDEAEKIIGCSADDLMKLRQRDDDSAYLEKLEEAIFSSHVFRVAVTHIKDKGVVVRLNVVVKAVVPVDPSAEASLSLKNLMKKTLN